MDHLAEEFVRRCKQQGLGSRGQRYPESLRRVAVRYGRWVLESGFELVEAARTLGVSPLTLGRWLEQDTTAPAPPVMHEVTVVEHEPPRLTGEMVIRTPDGFSIEGIDRSQLAEVLAVLRG